MALRRRILLVFLPLLAMSLTACVSGSSNTLIRNVQQRGIWYALGMLALALLGFGIILGLMALERKYQVLASLGLRSLLLRIPVIGPQLNAGLQVQASVMKGQSLKRQLKSDLDRNRQEKEKKQNDQAANPENAESSEPEFVGPGNVVPASAFARPTGNPQELVEEAAVVEPAGFQPTISRLPVPAEFVTPAYLLSSVDPSEFVGKRLGRYQMEALHRQHDLGRSYHAFDLKLNRPVTVTLLDSSLTADESRQTTLLEQVRLCSQLDHPVLQDIYDFELADGQLFIVSEAVQGQPLLDYWQQWVASGREIGYSDLLRIFEQLLSALRLGETQGMHDAHLAPERIHFEGSANSESFADGQLHLHNYAIWPQQENEADASAADDIHAIGGMLYHLTVGQPCDYDPTDPDSKLTAPAELRPGIPVDIEELILDALATDPAEQPTSIATFADLVAEIRETLGDRLMETGQINEGEPVVRIEVAGEPARMVRLNRETFYLGKEGRNDILLPGHGVANVHARLDRGTTGWEVSDLGSSHGSRLSDARLLPNLPETWLPSQTLFIGPYRLSLTLASVEELDDAVVNRSVGAALLPTAVEVMPGERADFQVSLVNQGNQVDHFGLRIEGVPETWVTISAAQVELMPGAKGYLLITIAPPKTPDSAAGTYPIQIHAHSLTDPAQQQTITGSLNVAAFDQLELDLHPEYLTNEGESCLSIRNLGNQPVTVELTGRDNEEALSFSWPEEESWVIEAGADHEFAIDIAARQRPMLGLQKRVAFDLNVTSNEQRHFLPGHLVITPRLPSWMVAASGMAVAFICLVIGFIGNLILLNRPVTLDADTQATATALADNGNAPEATIDPLSASDTTLMPSSCEQIRAQNGADTVDGEYTLYIAGDENRPVAIYCHDMARSATEFVTLATADTDVNFSSIVYPGQELVTTYERVQIDLQQLRIDPTNRTFATVTGSVPDNNQRIINDFGSAIGCNQQGNESVTGVANINLAGTPFALSEQVQFTFAGPDVVGNSEIDPSRITATLTVSGNCGWVIPTSQIPLAYVGPTQARSGQ